MSTSASCPSQRGPGHAIVRVGEGAYQPSFGPISITNQAGDYYDMRSTSIINNFQAPTPEADDHHDQAKFSRAEITAWLRGPNFRPIQQAAVAQRMLDTGAWFLQSPEFQDLVNHDGFQLWGTGMPGSGKTVLSAICVEHLERTYQGREDIGVAFAFFRYNERHSTRDIIAALLSQLVDTSNAAYTLANTTYAHARRIRAEPVEKGLIISLAEIRRTLKRVFVVLDGVDEASDDVKDQLLRVLPPTGVNLLIMSRPLPSFEHHIPNIARISIQARTEDIAVFVLEYIRRSSRLKTLLHDRPGEAAKLSAHVKESSNGMFLVARLQMEAVANATSVKRLSRALDGLPSGVGQMYDHTLNRIAAQSSEDIAIAWRVFIWLLHAYEPLTVQQMQTALCISFEQHTFDQDDEMPVSIILSICGGLITTERDGGKECFRFIHYTTREYLAKIPTLNGWNPHTILSVSCATYLTEHHIYGLVSEVAKLDGRNFKKALRFGDLNVKYRLWYYALRNWAPHAGATRGSGQLHPYLVSFFLEHSWHYWEWPDGSFDREGTRFHVALRFRLLPLLKGMVSPENQEQNHTQLLVNAAKVGDVEFFEALLSSYVVDGTQPRGDGDTFLHLAVRYGQTTLVEALLSEHGSRPPEGPGCAIWDANIERHVNAQNKAGETPLMVACQTEEIPLVRILSSYCGCDPNLRDSKGKTALFYACRGRTHDVAVALIQSVSKVDSGVQCVDGTTAFMEACDRLQEKTARCLLDLDSSLVSQIDISGRTALMRIFQGSPKQLSAQGALIPFCATFDLLLECKSSLWVRDHEGMTAFLHAVAYLNGAEPEQWLIKHCLERMCAIDPTIIKQRDFNGRTALMMAARGRGIGILSSGLIQFILAHPKGHPKPSFVKDNHRLTALAHAFKSSRTGPTLHDLVLKGDPVVLEVLRMLPSTWDAIPRAGNDDTLLHSCVRSGQVEIVEKLLALLKSVSTGNDDYINGRNGAGETPLILACRDQTSALIRVMASCQGCDPNLRDRSGRTAFFYACSRTDEDALPEVVAQTYPAVDVHVRDLDGITAFMKACQVGQEKTVKWLLQSGLIKVRDIGNKGRTTLMSLFVGVLRVAAAGHGTGAPPSLLAQFILSHPNHLVGCVFPKGNGLLGVLTARSKPIESPCSILHDLAANGDPVVLEVLRMLPSTPDTIPRAENGDTLLHSCVRSGQTEIVEGLLALFEPDSGGNGNYINAQNGAGETPLILACRDKKLALVQAMASHQGCEPNLQDSSGRTAFFYACSGASGDDFPKALVQAFPTADINTRDSLGVTAFVAACRTGQEKTVEWFLNNDPSKVYDVGHYWAAKGNPTILEAFHMFPSTWGAVSQAENGDTLLHCLVREGQSDVVKDLSVLLKSTATIRKGGKDDMNAQNRRGETPLILACRKQDLKLVRAMASHQDCDPNLRDTSGRTAFFYACSGANGDGFPEALAKAFPTVDINIRDSLGVSAFMEACQTVQRGTVKWFLRNDPTKVHEIDGEERTALMRLFLPWRSDHSNLAMVLLDHGSDLHARDRQGNSAFLLALSCGSRGILYLLKEMCELDREVVNHRTHNGATALAIALNLAPLNDVFEWGLDIRRDTVLFLLRQQNLRFHALRIEEGRGIVADPVDLTSEPHPEDAASWRSISWRVDRFHSLEAQMASTPVSFGATEDYYSPSRSSESSDSEDAAPWLKYDSYWPT